MNRSSKYLSNIPLLAGLASVLWVVDGILRRDITASVHPLTIVFYEFLVGTLLIIPIAGTSFFKEKPTIKELLVVTALSILSGPVAVGLFTYALFQGGTTSFSSIYVLQKLQPLFAVFFIWIVSKRKLHSHFFAYAFLALAGTFLLITSQSLITMQWQLSSMLGNLAALGAAFAWGVSALFSYSALKENSHQFVTISRFFWGCLFSFLGLLFFVHQPLIHVLTLPQPKDAGFVIVLGVISALISFIIYFKALQEASSLTTTFLELLYPLLALVADLAIYHHVPDFLQLLGMTTILFATIKINRLHNFTDLNEI